MKEIYLGDKYAQLLSSIVSEMEQKKEYFKETLSKTYEDPKHARASFSLLKESLIKGIQDKVVLDTHIPKILKVCIDLKLSLTGDLVGMYGEALLDNGQELIIEDDYIIVGKEGKISIACFNFPSFLKSQKNFIDKVLVSIYRDKQFVLRPMDIKDTRKRFLKYLLESIKADTSFLNQLGRKDYLLGSINKFSKALDTGEDIPMSDLVRVGEVFSMLT